MRNGNLLGVQFIIAVCCISFIVYSVYSAVVGLIERADGDAFDNFAVSLLDALLANSLFRRRSGVRMLTCFYLSHHLGDAVAVVPRSGGFGCFARQAKRRQWDGLARAATRSRRPTNIFLIHVFRVFVTFASQGLWLLFHRR